METREDAMETREDAREDASIDGAREEGGGEDDARDAETVEYFMEDVKVVDEVGTLRGLDLARYARLRTLRVVRQREVRSMVGLEACVGLRSVTVAECALTSWEGTEACEGLEELYVYGNAIRSIEGMWESGGFRRLQKLWVNDNALREIDAVTSLESLRELNAARNELRAVPRARSLEWLNVAGNPIRALEDVEPAQWTASLIFRDDVHGACALCRGQFYRSFVICALPNARAIDGVEITDDVRARAEEEHASRRLRYHAERARIVRSFRNARARATKHLRDVSESIERELTRAREGGEWTAMTRALVEIERAEDAFSDIEREARVLMRDTFADAFRRAEIVGETERERRFAQIFNLRAADAAKTRFADIFDRFLRYAREVSEDDACGVRSIGIPKRALSETHRFEDIRELNMHAAGLREIPPAVRQCTHLHTLILSKNSIQRLDGLPRNVDLRHVDLGRNELWNAGDLILLATRAPNLASVILRGNARRLSKKTFYAPILIKRMKTLRQIDGGDVPSDARARLPETKVTLRAVRRRGQLCVDERGENVVEFGLEDAHARVVEMCERLATTRAAHLANNCLQTLIAFSACKRLRHLTLDGNDAIRLDGLSLLSRLEVLRLRNCGIRALPAACFRSLRQLTRVDVEENYITSLSALDQCLALEEIYAAHEFSDVSDVAALASLPRLKLLTLYGNALGHAKLYQRYIVFKLPRLLVLDAEYVSDAQRAEAMKTYTGRLTVDMIPKTSRASEMTLASLGLLYLDHALIKARFQTIRQINFENNRLSDVSALGELPKLTKLRLRNNRVNAAFGRANAFERLTFLDLSGNCISSLSALSLGRCAQLRTLLLADNFLTRLDGINQLKSLRVLDADKNKLSRIDANTFDGCESFRVISLRKNAFRTVKHLKRLEHVRELRLDDNRIDDLQEISWLAYLPRLRALSLMGNVAAKVEKYDEFVTTCCRGLTSLDGKSVETLF